MNPVFPSRCLGLSRTTNIHSPKQDVSMSVYYMPSSASGQNQSISALLLATRAGKMELSCAFGATHCIPQENFPRKPYNNFFIDQVCSVKMADYWPRSFFCGFIDLVSISVYKHTTKELSQYPLILTSHLVNNTYIMIYCAGVSYFPRMP